MQGSAEYRSGVGIVLVNRHGLIFAGHRSDRRQPPWQMPQGGLHADESPRQAAIRELAEELGTDRAIILGTHPGWLHYDYPATHASSRAAQFRGQRHKWFLARFTGQDSDVDVDTPHAEFCDWRWMSPDELIDRVVAFKRPVYREVLSRFGPALRMMGAYPAEAAAGLAAGP